MFEDATKHVKALLQEANEGRAFPCERIVIRPAGEGVVAVQVVYTDEVYPLGGLLRVAGDTGVQRANNGEEPELSSKRT